MHYLLHRHQWSDIHDWVGAMSILADLTDAEIEQVAVPRQQESCTKCTEDESQAGGG